MLEHGSLFGGRFRVLRNFAPAASAIALAEDLSGPGRVWLVSFRVTASEAQVHAALEQHWRFALGVPGLARPIASGVDGGRAFLAFAAPEGESVAEAHASAWPVLRVAQLASRVAAAFGPLHDQGIAYGCLRPELLVERDGGELLFGFGVAALATAFGARGESSQVLAPAYRAPELGEAPLAPTPLSDVYALGVLIGELLLPPGLSSEASVGSPEASLPAKLQALLTAATAAEPRLRPTDVRAFAAQFEHLAQLALEVPVVAVGLDAPVAAGPSPNEVPPPSQFRADTEPLVPSAMPEPSLPAPAWRPTPVASRSSGAPFVLGAVLVGLLLMVGAVGGASFYAARHALRAGRVAAAAPTHHHLPTTGGPRLTVPGPTDDPLPVPPPAAAPKQKHGSGHSVLRHTPLVPPGVGPSAFPEDARAALPVLGREPTWGTRNALLTWVLFGDLDCPHTRHAWRALEAAKVSFGDDLRIVFRHRPLREHEYALDAARVLAGLELRRGAAAFFQVLHRIAQDDTGLTPERLLADLSAAGYGDSNLAELAELGTPAVAADLELSGQFSVRSTPMSFVNGARVDGERSPDEIERVLLDERRSATWLLAAGTAAPNLYSSRTNSNLVGVGDAEASRVCAPVLDSPMRGPADALLTLVEFSDFECPYCRRVEPTLKALLARYPRTLRLIWKDYPLPQHKKARLLANFAAEAQARGSNAAFWAVHDSLFAEQGAFDDPALGELAGKAGLDGAGLLIAAHAGAHEPEIHADVALGERLGVNGTPLFFLNGRRVQGAQSFDQFDALIQKELKSAERIVAHGVARDKLYRLVCDTE